MADTTERRVPLVPHPFCGGELCGVVMNPDLRPPSDLLAQIMFHITPWHAQGMAVMRWLAKGRIPWTTEDILAILARAGAYPPSNGAVGALVLRAQLEGLIKRTGESRCATRPAAKGRRLQLWIGVRQNQP